MNTPYFLWDYNLSARKVRTLLKKGDEHTRRWLVARILSHANFNDIFKYLTINEIITIFPKLRMSKEIKQAWEKAFVAWGYHVES